MATCARGCGREFKTNEGKKPHEKRCFFPRTLERALELIEVEHVPAPEHVQPMTDCWVPRRIAHNLGFPSNAPYRAIFELASGAIVPKKTDICHKCDNNPCCNPDHLYAGSRSQNIRDAVVRGRWPNQVSPETNAKRSATMKAVWQQNGYAERTGAAISRARKKK